MRLFLDFPDSSSLRAAIETVRAQHGLMLQIEAPDVGPNTPIAIVLTTPGETIEIEGQFIQALGPHGIAVRFNPDDSALDAVPRAADGGAASAAPTARWEGASAARATEPAATASKPAADTRRPKARPTDIPIRERLKTATKAEKIQLALHGTRPERNLIIRDRDKSLHQYVIRNPKLGLDEVATIAKMSTVAPDVLKHIAGKREWFQRPDVASALVRNPKVSAVVAKKMLAFVSARELRQLAKGSGVREAIAQEARRRLLRK